MLCSSSPKTAAHGACPQAPTRGPPPPSTPYTLPFHLGRHCRERCRCFRLHDSPVYPFTLSAALPVHPCPALLGGARLLYYYYSLLLLPCKTCLLFAVVRDHRRCLFQRLWLPLLYCSVTLISFLHTQFAAWLNCPSSSHDFPYLGNTATGFTLASTMSRGGRYGRRTMAESHHLPSPDRPLRYPGRQGCQKV
jgi:hypothetical protein